MRRLRWQGATRLNKRQRHAALFAVFTLALTLVFGRLAAYNLGNYRPATNDEVELLSVGFKLATRGVMGSDLFAGFAGANRHYLFTLPLQHVLEAMSFGAFGAGLAQARWVSLLAGVSTVWLVGWLAYRWYGLGTAIVCELLLVAWPSNITLASDGLPLWGVARVARYDVLAVAFVWLAIALLDATLRRPRPATALSLGLCCGLAALTTFTGAFAAPLVGVACLWMRTPARSAATVGKTQVRTLARSAAPRRTYRWWTLVGTGLPLLPWVAYCAANRADLTAQLAVYGGRWNVLQPTFLIANLVAEPSRFHDLLTVPTWSAWLLAIGIWPALAYAAWRSRSPRSVGDRIVVASLVTFGALLAVVDQTKTPLYAIILVPSVCLAVASLLAGAIGWACRSIVDRRPEPAIDEPHAHAPAALDTQPSPPLDGHAPPARHGNRARLGHPSVTSSPAGVAVLVSSVAVLARRVGVVAGALAVLLGVGAVLVGVGVDGVRAYRQSLAQAARANPYLDVGLQIDRGLLPGGRVLGPERWWWPLHDHPYLSLRSIWFQWTADATVGEPRPFAEWVAATQAEGIVINDNVRGDILDFPPALQQQFWAYVDACTTDVLDLDDPTYLQIEVHTIIVPYPSPECS